MLTGGLTRVTGVTEKTGGEGKISSEGRGGQFHGRRYKRSLLKLKPHDKKRYKIIEKLRRKTEIAGQ